MIERKKKEKTHHSQKLCIGGQTKLACPRHWQVQRVCTDIPYDHGSHTEVQIQPCIMLEIKQFCHHSRIIVLVDSQLKVCELALNCLHVGHEVYFVQRFFYSIWKTKYETELKTCDFERKVIINEEE